MDEKKGTNWMKVAMWIAGVFIAVILLIGILNQRSNRLNVVEEDVTIDSLYYGVDTLNIDTIELEEIPMDSI